MNATHLREYFHAPRGRRGDWVKPELQRRCTGVFYPASFAETAQVEFFRHEEIYRPIAGSQGGQPSRPSPVYRLDEFPVGYSSAGCSPAVPASASPTELSLDRRQFPTQAPRTAKFAEDLTNALSEVTTSPNDDVILRSRATKDLLFPLTHSCSKNKNAALWHRATEEA